MKKDDGSIIALGQIVKEKRDDNLISLVTCSLDFDTREEIGCTGFEDVIVNRICVDMWRKAGEHLVEHNNAKNLFRGRNNISGQI